MQPTTTNATARDSRPTDIGCPFFTSPRGSPFRGVCFIDQPPVQLRPAGRGPAAERAGGKPTPKQLAFAESIAKATGKALPDYVRMVAEQRR